MTPEERVFKLRSEWGDYIDHDAIAAAIRNAAAEEREAILKTLRLLRDEHSPTHDWCNGIKDSIACVEARGKTPCANSSATKPP